MQLTIKVLQTPNDKDCKHANVEKKYQSLDKAI